MSQFSFSHQGYTILIGWNKELKSFYAQVKDLSYDKPVLWLGQLSGEYSAFRLLMQELDMQLKKFCKDEFRITQAEAEKIMKLKEELKLEKAQMNLGF